MQTSLHSHQLEAAMAELLSSHHFSKKWYQGDGGRVVFAILTTLLGYLSVFVFGLHPPIILSAAAVLVLAIGLATDITTTHQVFLLKKQYDDRGLEYTTREENPLLPDVPNLRDLVLGKPTLLAVVAGLLAFFIPLAGFGIAAALFAVSLNNHRNYQQTQYELQLFDRMTMKNWEKKEIPG